ncbi:hypothetical protein [Corynebacterium auriscanis]|uniref:Uncharacterized protein n=1 Tax=Corynebacterium auriscanis TaxID=99807 RepID=A0A0A2DI10_9CORY|nr:hypothetical protein [Corynebacterium auriscanis]KGM18823.1 hypothetical protein MA47_04000 [Corynebacterium auriscanis]WJY73645.1 hypothetical protein CAURIC_10230 [Corynebacterium auriscanis]
MSEKLTVAELLARSGRTPKDGEADRPRRRRRSLEHGGVSVAELTGNIPVVKDEHLEGEEGAEKPAEKAAAKLAEKPAEKPAAKVVEKPAEKPAARVAEKLVEKPAARVAEKPAEKPVTKVAEKPAAKVAEKPAEKPAAKVAEKPVEAPQTGTATKAPRPAAGVAAAGAGAASKPGAKTEGKVPAEARERVASKEKKLPEEKLPGTKSNSAPLPDNEEVRKLQAQLGEHEVLEYEDDRISWPAMIVQALLAVVLGVGVFFGFSMLWDRMGAGIVLILALAVTLFLVGIVHAILRHKDKWILLLAFIVGLVLTVGPRLILGM